MLRQLAKLTRQVPAAGPRALAIAVYADELDVLKTAQESGFEGVACVDDAARGCAVLCDLWTATQAPWVRAWAEGLFDFLLWMHRGDGRWVNFISDWTGEQNTSGVTSAPGVNFWQARAIFALVKGWIVLGDERAREPIEMGMALAASASPPAEIRVIHASAILDLFRVAHSQEHRTRLESWCEEIANCRLGDVLMNAPAEQGSPHLWGHIQEGILAMAGAALGRDDLRAIAQTSADVVFCQIIESGFELERVQAYDVQSAIYVMDALTTVTGAERYKALARKARMWFDGRNSAHQPVYDRQTGRVADGIDNGRLNKNSGAESNIAACQSLLSDAAALVRELTGSGYVNFKSAPLP